MANARTFDPRAFSSADESTLGNAAVSSPYEPGSVNKVVTIAAALEYGTAAPDRVFAVPGSIRVADRTVQRRLEPRHRGLHADRHPREVVERRHDHGGAGGRRGPLRGHARPVRAGQAHRRRAAGRERRAGAGARDLVGVDVRQPAHRSGPVGDGAADGRDVPGGRQRRRARPAADRRGHGRAGRRPHPDPGARAGAGRVPGDRARSCGRCSPRSPRTGGRQDTRGTGSAAAIPGYQVAGKTGTAQQVDPACGCYASSIYWITFAGMLPAQDPRYVVAIMLDAPQGGTSAAPLFHEIGSYLAQREKLPVSPEPPLVQTLVTHAPPARPTVPAPAGTPAPGAPAAPAGPAASPACRAAARRTRPAGTPPALTRTGTPDSRTGTPNSRTETPDSRAETQDSRVRWRADHRGWRAKHARVLRSCTRVLRSCTRLLHPCAASGEVGRRSGAIMGAGSLPACRTPAPPPSPRLPRRRGPGPRDAWTCTSSRPPSAADSPAAVDAGAPGGRPG